jgi:hypothetical protein
MCNGAKQPLHDWKPLNVDAQSPFMRGQVEAQVAILVSMAHAQTLATFGEVQAASELLDSSRDRALREIDRLRSFSSRKIA